VTSVSRPRRKALLPASGARSVQTGGHARASGALRAKSMRIVRPFLPARSACRVEPSCRRGRRNHRSPSWWDLDRIRTIDKRIRLTRRDPGRLPGKPVPSPGRFRMRPWAGRGLDAARKTPSSPAGILSHDSPMITEPARPGAVRGSAPNRHRLDGALEAAESVPLGGTSDDDGTRRPRRRETPPRHAPRAVGAIE